MQTPPPFQNPGMMPPMPAKSNNKLLWGIIIGVVVLCCGGVITVVMMGIGAVKSALPLAACTMKFKHVRDAITTYAATNNGMLPPADTWQDAIKPQLDKLKSAPKSEDDKKLEEVFGLNGDDFTCTPADGSPTGMAYNADLAGKTLASIKDLSTPMLFEVPEVKKNNAMPYKPLTAPSPKIKMFFKEIERGWIFAPVSGEVATVKDGKITTIRSSGKFD